MGQHIAKGLSNFRQYELGILRKLIFSNKKHGAILCSAHGRKSSRVIISLVCIFLFILSISYQGYARAEEKLPSKIYLPHKPVFPFKAETIDECIHEKECAWYYFVKFQERFPQETREQYKDQLSESDKNPIVSKWGGSVHILILPQEKNQSYVRELEEVLVLTRPHFPYDLKITSKGITAIIMFSSDFKRDLFTTYRDIFQLVFGGHIFSAYSHYGSMFPKSVTESFPFHDKQKQILGAAIFIKPDWGSRGKSLDAEIFYNLGFKGGGFNTPFLVKGPQGRMNDLHFFLLRVLYHPEMKSGTQVSEARRVFEKIYLEVLKQFDVYRERKGIVEND